MWKTDLLVEQAKIPSMNWRYQNEANTYMVIVKMNSSLEYLDFLSLSVVLDWFYFWDEAL